MSLAGEKESRKSRTKLVYGGLQPQVRGFMIYLKEMGICSCCETGGIDNNVK